MLDMRPDECYSTAPGLTRSKDTPMPQAAHTHTTGCFSAPSRRQLGGSTLAALCGAAFAGAVMLPDPGEAFPAPPSPDAHLLALYAEFFCVNTSVEAVRDDDALASVRAARDTLAERISATRAASATGLQAKARVGHFLMNERHCPGTSFDDVDTYALTLLRELMAGTVEPVPVLASPDAELIRLCAECDALQARIDAHYAAPWEHLSPAEQTAREQAIDAANQPLTDQKDPLLERICDLRAATLEGNAARARTLMAWDKDPCWTHDGCWNSQLTGAIVRDLTAVA